MMKNFRIGILWLSLVSAAHAAPDFNIVMMENTVKITGDNGSVGTGFLVARQSRVNPKCFAKVLVTADHVFRGITGTNATLVFRRYDSNGWHRVDFPIKIRSGTNELWSKHPKLDVAAIVTSVPYDLFWGTEKFPRKVLSVRDLISKEAAEKIALRPGARLQCLGYPFGMEGNATGFPVLRQGTVASYPVLPVKDHPTFLFSFDVFGGNSGGPVYVSELMWGEEGEKEETNFGRLAGIVGIVIERWSAQNESLSISTVIQAEYIREVIDGLPEPAALATRP